MVLARPSPLHLGSPPVFPPLNLDRFAAGVGGGVGMDRTFPSGVGDQGRSRRSRTGRNSGDPLPPDQQEKIDSETQTFWGFDTSRLDNPGGAVPGVPPQGSWANMTEGTGGGARVPRQARKRPWPRHPDGSPGAPSPRGLDSVDFGGRGDESPVSFQDGVLEVVAVEGVLHLGQIQVSDYARSLGKSSP